MYAGALVNDVSMTKRINKREEFSKQIYMFYY